MDIHQLFNQLVEKKELSVKTLTKTNHENLRTRLVKLFSRHKSTLTDIGYDDGTGVLSVCAEFLGIEGAGTSVYKIDKRKAQEKVDYEIIELVSTET